MRNHRIVTNVILTISNRKMFNIKHAIARVKQSDAIFNTEEDLISFVRDKLKSLVKHNLITKNQTGYFQVNSRRN